MKWKLGLHGGSSYESIASIVALDFLHNYGVGMRRVPQTDLKLILVLTSASTLYLYPTSYVHVYQLLGI